MTEIEKSRIVSLWESGMTLGQIRQMVAVGRVEFADTVREMKRNGEFPTTRKTAEEKVVAAFQRGDRNPYAIAEEYGLSVHSVRSFLGWNKCHKGKKTRNWVHCDRTDAIVEDLQEGALSQSEIARKYGVSRQYITKMKRKVEKWNEPNVDI